tara:strand:+ start:1076 stop:1696 length:621 start_codon:yes stop_codon:yes gene_type:complete
MAITNYTELKSTIADWLNRDDLTSVIPTFISLAEHQMERSVRHYKMIVRKAALLDTQYTDLPNDWLETIRVHLTSGDTHRLELVSLDDMVELREKSGNTAGRPRYYAHIGDTIEVYPTPDSSYDIELMYYQKIFTLSTGNTSNWLLDRAPDAYLYGALLAASPYLSEDERIEVWGGLYSSAINALNNTSDASRDSGSGLKMRFVSH